MKKNDTRINFLNYKFVSNAEDQLLELFANQVVRGEKIKLVFTPNPEQIIFAKSYSWFDKLLGKADFLLPDGVGIIIGSQILSAFGKTEPILKRITGVDIVSGLLQIFSKEKKVPKILIIGGRKYEGHTYLNWKIVSVNNTGKKSEFKVQKNLLYWHEGFLNVMQPTKDEELVLMKSLKVIQPDVIFVAFGAPYQEKWIVENKKELERLGVRLVMAVGGTFDMLLGKVERAPKWIQKIGLEWLFRLRQEPWRWRRQVSLLQYIKLIVQEVLN